MLPTSEIQAPCACGGLPGELLAPDLTARTFADPLSKLLGQPVIVENKVGAGGNIGAAEVARAKDDHTIGLINGNMTIAKILNPAAPLDPLKDLAPLSLIGVSPLVLRPRQSSNWCAQERRCQGLLCGCTRRR